MPNPQQKWNVRIFFYFDSWCNYSKPKFIFRQPDVLCCLTSSKSRWYLDSNSSNFSTALLELARRDSFSTRKLSNLEKKSIQFQNCTIMTHDQKIWRIVLLIILPVRFWDQKWTISVICRTRIATAPPPIVNLIFPAFESGIRFAAMPWDRPPPHCYSPDLLNVIAPFVNSHALTAIGPIPVFHFPGSLGLHLTWIWHDLF